MSQPRTITAVSRQHGSIKDETVPYLTFTLIYASEMVKITDAMVRFFWSKMSSRGCRSKQTATGVTQGLVTAHRRSRVWKLSENQGNYLLESFSSHSLRWLLCYVIIIITSYFKMSDSGYPFLLIYWWVKAFGNSGNSHLESVFES